MDLSTLDPAALINPVAHADALHLNRPQNSSSTDATRGLSSTSWTPGWPRASRMGGEAP